MFFEEKWAIRLYSPVDMGLYVIDIYNPDHADV